MDSFGIKPRCPRREDFDLVPEPYHKIPRHWPTIRHRTPHFNILVTEAHHSTPNTEPAQSSSHYSDFSFILFLLRALTILPYNSNNMLLYFKNIYIILSQNVPSYMFRLEKAILRKIYIQRNSGRRCAKRIILKTTCRVTLVYKYNWSVNNPE
jgi:hypothetical protein